MKNIITIIVLSLITSTSIWSMEVRYENKVKCELTIDSDKKNKPDVIQKFDSSIDLAEFDIGYKNRSLQESFENILGRKMVPDALYKVLKKKSENSLLKKFNPMFDLTFTTREKAILIEVLEGGLDDLSIKITVKGTSKMEENTLVFPLYLVGEEYYENSVVATIDVHDSLNVDFLDLKVSCSGNRIRKDIVTYQAVEREVIYDNDSGLYDITSAESSL